MNLGTRDLIKSFYKSNKRWFILSVFAAFAMGVLNLIVSWILQISVDVATGISYLGFKDLINTIASLILLAILVLGLDSFVYPQYLKRAMTNYKGLLLQGIMDKNIGDFQCADTSVYISALTNDANIIEEKYVKSTINLITEISTFIGALGLMLYFSPLMTFISIGLTLIPVIVSSLTGGKLVPIEKNISENNSFFVDTIADFTRGFTLVKNFKAENSILKNLKLKNKELEESKARSNTTKMIIQMLGACAGIVTQLGVVLVGVYLILQSDEFTTGMLVSFVNLMNFIISPVAKVPTILAERKAAKALIGKAANLVSANYTNNKKEKISNLEKSIKFENVSFAYEEGKNILADLSFEFERGKSYALVGASGSGKSTILKLIMNEIEEDDGVIFYDEIDMDEVSIDSIYEEISMIQQNVFVFNASIYDNITMFQDFDEDLIKTVIQRSSLTKLVNEKGLDYMCGENGKNLSGGEKQRLAIARALLKKSSVILTDEATSSLDKETAYQIINDIIALEDKTRIMVTHSLDKAILSKYDEIVVLKNGNVEEQGHFDDLIDAKGYFYYLYSVS